MLFNNFRNQVKGIIKKIENGKANDENVFHLLELLNAHPEMIPDVAAGLNDIMQKGNKKAYNLAISAMNKMAKNYIGLADFSVETIVACLRKRKNDLSEDGMPEILEILMQITKNHPGHMRTAVPELLGCLENSSAESREMAHFTLTLITATHHEFFNGHQKGIIRVLNGLNVDERIYACRLIKKIAEKEKAIVVDTYDLLEDLHLNHPDSKLRSEAGFAIEMFKEPARKNRVEKRPANPKKKLEPDYIFKEKPGKSDYTSLSELVAPNKEDLARMLEGMSLGHLIVNR